MNTPWTNRGRLLDLPIHNEELIAPADLALVRKLTSGQTTLIDVPRWGSTQVPPVTPVLSVAQDEFSHELVVPFGKTRFLVYEVT